MKPDTGFAPICLESDSKILLLDESGTNYRLLLKMSQVGLEPTMHRLKGEGDCHFTTDS